MAYGYYHPTTGETARESTQRSAEQGFSTSFSPGMDDWVYDGTRYVPPGSTAPAGGGGGTPTPAPAPGGTGGGGGGGGGGPVPPPAPTEKSKPLQGLQSAMQRSGAGWQQTDISPGQMDLGSRTPPMALDILRQVVAARGKAY